MSLIRAYLVLEDNNQQQEIARAHSACLKHFELAGLEDEDKDFYDALQHAVEKPWIDYQVVDGLPLFDNLEQQLALLST